MEHLQFTVKHIKQETAESRSYFLREINGREVPYKAGQFLTIIITLHGKEVRRSYSISSAPGVDDTIFFTVKKVENGEVSRYLLNTLKVGDVITSLPPTGRFIVTEPETNHHVFIVAGSGITPVFSLIKHLLYNTENTRVLLINQNRNEAEAIFRNDLLKLHGKFTERLELKEVFSQPLNHSRFPQRLNNNLLERILHNSVGRNSTVFYLCGPDAFMRMALFTLKVLGYSNDVIKKENFFASPPPPPFLTDHTPRNVAVNYHGRTYNLKVAYPHTILEVALKHHIHLPYSCRGGRCSTCTARCTSGQVKMSINDVLTPVDLADGLILTCVSYPLTDVEITFDAEVTSVITEEPEVE